MEAARRTMLSLLLLLVIFSALRKPTEGKASPEVEIALQDQADCQRRNLHSDSADPHFRHLRVRFSSNHSSAARCDITTVRNTLLGGCSRGEFIAYNLSQFWASPNHYSFSEHKQKPTNISHALVAELLRRLDCDKLAGRTKTSPARLNFLSTSTSPTYEIYLPYYTFFAISNNPSSVAELVVKNRTSFAEKFARELQVLVNHFERQHLEDPFCIREFSTLATQFHDLHPSYWSNSARFFEVPVLEANFTYVGDTDVMIIEDALAKHYKLRHANSTAVFVLNHETVMEHYNIPYSNLVRPNFKVHRLTGVYVARTKDYYSPQFVKTLTKYATDTSAFRALTELAEKEVGKWGMDEVLLYHLCNETHGAPPKANHQDVFSGYKPLHGMHLSTHITLKNNKPLNAKSWCQLIHTVTPSLFDQVIHAFPSSCKFFTRFWRLTVGNYEAATTE